MRSTYNNKADSDDLGGSVHSAQIEMARNHAQGDVRVLFTGDGVEPSAIPCKVEITGDTVADRKRIEKKFPTRDGWTCTTDANDSKKSTCTNP